MPPGGTRLGAQAIADAAMKSRAANPHLGNACANGCAEPRMTSTLTRDCGLSRLVTARCAKARRLRTQNSRNRTSREGAVPAWHQPKVPPAKLAGCKLLI
jgi:hypothetical protein